MKLHNREGTAPAWATLALLIGLIGGCSRDTPQPTEPVADDGLPPLPAPGDDLPANEAEAVRFLTRSTFGPSRSDREAVLQVGFSAWIDWQVQMPTSEALVQLKRVGSAPELDDWVPESPYASYWHHLARERHFYGQAVWGPDQLRQRLVWALSQIFVVSQSSGRLSLRPVLLADYYDMLGRHAFGNYRDLLEDVTLHPAMGIFLSMAGNRKADPQANTRPDENFAREVMQLFSIGLFQLNERGEARLDDNGERIPTYDQDVIKGMARALTGWTFHRTDVPNGSLAEFVGTKPRIGRMEPWPEFHESGAKLLIDGNLDPGGKTAEEDLERALDLLAAHPNVGPFLGKQLIQRLVTSNPSEDYVARVAAVWADDGDGARGNLEAVVRAILLDPEAMAGTAGNPNFGKVREPILRATALWRAFEAEQKGETFAPGNSLFFNQGPLAAPSVFNFFRPTFSTQELAANGLVAPEMQITTHGYSTRVANVLDWLIHQGNAQNVEEHYEGPVLAIDELTAAGADTRKLIDMLDVRMLGGTMSAELRGVLQAYSETFDPGLERALGALHLLVLSPDFAVQK